MKPTLRWLCFLVSLNAVAVEAGAIRNLPGFASNTYGPNDDGTYPCTSLTYPVPPGCTPTTVPIGFDIDFYGSTYNQVYLNNNGNLTFDASLSEFTPFALTNSATRMIAVFFADVDTRVGNTVTFGNDTVDGHAAFGVNWIDVGYFSQNVDKLNRFQLILINRSDRRAGDFDIEFNYDQIQWETGDASDGVNGQGGDSAVVGFSDGSGLPGTSFQLPGSAVPGELLDSNPGGLVHGSLNTNVPGRYVIPIVNLTNLVLTVPPVSQADARWAGMAYANSAFTIQQKGCALSCLAMALNYEGISTDPGQLNTLLINKGDFVEQNGIIWDAATRDASSSTLEFHSYRTSSAQFLSLALSEGHPVIVGVNLNANGEPGHFVLVVGEQSGHFIINDPGHAGATSLDYYNNKFETRGYVGDPPGDVSGFDLALGNAADLLVVDPIGRRTGYIPGSGRTLEEIPRSVHFSDCLEANDLTGAPGTNTTHQVQLYQPLPGHYQIFLLGTNGGAYQLALRSFSSNGTPATPLNLTGTKSPNAIVPFQVKLASTGVTAEPFTNQCSWSVTPTYGPSPLIAHFTGPTNDVAQNAITNWNWDFGDGAKDSGQNPVHTYASGGVFFPSLIATDSAGRTVISFGPSIIVPDLVFNGGFELGDFIGWSLSGDISFTYVAGFEAHAGLYGAALGTTDAPGFMSQTIPTVAGAQYRLSLWLDSPDGETPNEFSVSWNGITLMDQVNIGAIGWTNLQFRVAATGPNTVLQFGFRNDPSYLGLDDVSLAPLAFQLTGIHLSGPNLVINGNNGQSGGTYKTMMSTNLLLPLTQWTPVATNVLTGNGDFSITVTNGASGNVRQRYYFLQLQ